MKTSAAKSAPAILYTSVTSRCTSAPNTPAFRLKAIGRQFGRDHSTVINARDNVINRMKKDSAFDKEIRELSKELTTL